VRFAGGHISLTGEIGQGSRRLARQSSSFCWQLGQWAQQFEAVEEDEREEYDSRDSCRDSTSLRYVVVAIWHIRIPRLVGPHGHCVQSLIDMETRRLQTAQILADTWVVAWRKASGLISVCRIATS
jgi:hypothetical protein